MGHKTWKHPWTGGEKKITCNNYFYVCLYFLICLCILKLPLGYGRGGDMESNSFGKWVGRQPVSQWPMVHPSKLSELQISRAFTEANASAHFGVEMKSSRYVLTPIPIKRVPLISYWQNSLICFANLSAPSLLCLCFLEFKMCTVALCSAKCVNV